MNLNEKTDNVDQLESRIQLLSIIGEVEGHEALGERTKATKYEQILPRLAMIEEDERVEGLLILLNTVGGDVEAGLAIAEMIASLSKPTVSLVLGRRSFHWSSPGSFLGLQLYCAKRYHGDPSGENERNVYWRSADLSEYGKNSGSDHRFYCRAFPYYAGEIGRADAGYLSVGERCGNHVGWNGSGKGRFDRRGWRNQRSAG